MPVVRGDVVARLSASRPPGQAVNETWANRSTLPSAGLTRTDWVSHLGIAGSFVALVLYACLQALTPQGAPALYFCPWRALTGLPCPTCGIVRSLGAALRGDLHSSFAFHPLGLAIFAGTAWLACKCVVGIWQGRPVCLSRRATWYVMVFGLACWAAKLASPVGRW